MTGVLCLFPYFLYAYVTRSGKTGLIATITDIHFLPVRESCTHALPRDTKCLIIDGQICFYRRLFTDAVKSPGCILWPWRALIGLHGVPGCSSWLSWPPLWIPTGLCPILRAQHCCLGPNGCLARLWLPTLPPIPLPPAHPL